jgi:hypothetical protein
MPFTNSTTIAQSRDRVIPRSELVNPRDFTTLWPKSDPGSQSSHCLTSLSDQMPIVNDCLSKRGSDHQQDDSSHCLRSRDCACHPQLVDLPFRSCLPKVFASKHTNYQRTDSSFKVFPFDQQAIFVERVKSCTLSWSPKHAKA